MNQNYRFCNNYEVKVISFNIYKVILNFFSDVCLLIFKIFLYKFVNNIWGMGIKVSDFK